MKLVRLGVALALGLAVVAAGAATSSASARNRVVISEMSSYSGPITGGFRVHVHAQNIDSHLQVTLLGRPIEYRRISPYAISFEVPSRSRPGSGYVRIRNADGDMSVANPRSVFTYYWPRPVITSVTPILASSNGADVVVHGRWLVHIVWVKVGGSYIRHYTVDGDHRAVRFSLVHAPGRLPVEIAAGGWRAKTALRVVEPPKVGTIVPVNGSTSGGTAITIHGHFLGRPTTVSIGGRPATHVLGVDGDTITAVTPAHPSGSADVVVTNAVGDSGNSGEDGYRYGPVRAQTWGPARTVDTVNSISQIACVGNAFCMATDSNNRYLTYNGTTWTPPSPDTAAGAAGGWALSCPSASFCLSADLDYVWTWDGTDWTRIASPTTNSNNGNDIAAVSCTSSTFCVLMGLDRVWVYNGTSISADTTPFGTNQYLTGLSCWADGACAVSDSNAHLAALSSGTWTDAGTHLFQSPTFDEVSSLTCFDSTHCLAGTTGGSMLTQAGITTHVLPEAVTRLSCTSDVSCLAVGNSSTATYDGSVWSTSSTAPAAITAVSCPAEQSCTVASGHDVRSLGW